MKLTRLAKSGGSGETGCPTVYLGESGEFVVQGPLADQDTMANLENPLLEETAVRIDAESLLAACDRYRRDPL